MRNVRTMVVGVAVAVCALGVVATPAFAKKKEKKPVIFGKFVASELGKAISPESPVVAKTKEGEVTDLKLGPVETEECARELKSSGRVELEESETFVQNVTFKDCPATFGSESHPSKVFIEKDVGFTLGMKFHSNHSVSLGGVEEESEVELSRTPVSFKISRTACELVIPEQTIPIKAITKPESEFESAEYTTEEEPVSGKKKLKMFPSGFQKKLSIGWELSKIVTYLKPNPACRTNAPIDENPESPYKGDAVFTKGEIEAELEDITIKNGSLSFVPAE